MPTRLRTLEEILAIEATDGIAAAHGGSLVADSAPGRGSTFTLTLPAPAPS